MEWADAGLLSASSRWARHMLLLPPTSAAAGGNRSQVAAVVAAAEAATVVAERCAGQIADDWDLPRRLVSEDQREQDGRVLKAYYRRMDTGELTLHTPVRTALTPALSHTDRHHRSIRISRSTTVVRAWLSS